MLPSARRSRSRRLLSLLGTLLILGGLLPVAAAAPVQAASPNIVVSEVYGAGGNGGALLTHDYIELYNRGTATASLAGNSVQYASATGTGNFGASATQLTELPAVTLAPGQHFLIQEAGGTVGAALPTPDLIDPTPIAMGATGGKVVYVTGATTSAAMAVRRPAPAPSSRGSSTSPDTATRTSLKARAPRPPVEYTCRRNS